MIELTFRSSCLIFSLQVYALKLNPVVSQSDTTVIHPNDYIIVSWTLETGDPARFDINLLWPNGTLTLLAPDVVGQDGKIFVKLGDIPAPA